MFQFLSRQPFAIVGAIGLVSIFKGFLTLHEDVLQIVLAYQTVTFYIWNLLFWWIEAYFFPIPVWLKQYLILGLIHNAAAFRAFKYFKEQSGFIPIILLSILTILIWPWLHVANIYSRHEIVKIGAGSKDQYLRDRKKISNSENREAHDQLFVNFTKIKDSQRIFIEFLCWALALILLSYGLFFFKG